MKSLIVDDNFTNRLLLQEYLKPYGPVHIAVNGKEALEAVISAMDLGEPYDLICLDIMMPEMDGQEALKAIRKMETERGVMMGAGVKIVMTTALSDKENVFNSFHEQCDAYLVKPVEKIKLLYFLQQFGLIG